MAFDEARAAARQAVALEPHNWRHQYRLGHATWGADRLRALERTVALYPQFAYAHLEMAMLFVARRDFEAADRIARAGGREQDRQARSGNRFPAIGFHWLLGALDASAGHHDSALFEFGHEVEQSDARRLYGPEYAAAALTARGHTELSVDRPADALESFRAAHRHVDGFVRASIGEATTLECLGRTTDAGRVWRRVESGRDHLERTGRTPEALLVRACEAAMREDRATAVGSIDRFLAIVPPCHVGWTIPIEPCFRILDEDAAFTSVLARIAERAL